jgi:hypothetical protein
MRKATVFLLLLAVAMALLLASCVSGSDPAARAVEGYLNALVSKDANRLSTLSCADWASSALSELDSLQAVSTKLENLSCKTSGTDGDYTLVTCQGKIIATYNNENQELDLSVRTYQVVQKGSEYLMCGYR